jgi:hypothetical protein
MEQRKMKQYEKNAAQGVKKNPCLQDERLAGTRRIHDNKSPYQAMAGGMIELSQ